MESLKDLKDIIKAASVPLGLVALISLILLFIVNSTVFASISTEAKSLALIIMLIGLISAMHIILLKTLNLNSQTNQQYENIESLGDDYASNLEEWTIRKLPEEEDTNKDNFKNRNFLTALHYLGEFEDKHPAEFDLAMADLKRGNTSSAEKLLQSIVDDESLSSQTRGESAVNLGILRKDKNRLKALKDYEKANKLLPDDVGIMIKLAWAYEEVEEFLKAINVFSAILDIGEREENLILQAKALGGLGYVYYERQDLDAAEKMQKKSLEINKELKREKSIASAYISLGCIYYDRGEFSEAELIYNKALAINKKLNNQKSIATIYGNLAAIYATKGEIDESLKMSEKSLKMEESYGSKSGMAYMHGNLGLLAFQQQQFDKAEDHFLRSKELFEDVGKTSMVVKSVSRIAMLNELRNVMDKP